MRPPTPERRSRRWTSSAACSTAHRRCTSRATGRPSTAWPPSATTTRGWPPGPGTSSPAGCSPGTSWTGEWPACRGSAAPTAARSPTPPRTCRSSGWRMCHSSRPTAGHSADELIAGVENGIYILGDKSWSIDMQRYNFQFTAQRFYKIEHGRLAGQLRDVAYQATTTDFWNSMEAVGGPQTYVLGGAFNCGKGQPSQVAPVSHGCPAVLMRGVRILNTVEEGA